ncbi:MAG: DegT/DnrJ/EryC1/StrS family aminotransferase [Candidatus Cybelea sp.]
MLDLRPSYAALKEEIDTAIAGVLERCDFIMGSEVTAFESDVAAYLNAGEALGVNSGTDALLIALEASGVGRGAEVITTPFSFFATAEAIATVGAEPVFVDIDGGSLNIDPHLVEAAVTPKTKAIIPVHLYGRPANVEALVAIGKARGLVVIEDCAQSFGSRIGGRKTGTFGDVGAFSFFPSKPLGGFGDGGMIVTNDADIAQKARALRSHGSIRKYFNERIGHNSRLDTIQAAILRVKLSHVDAWNDARRRVAHRYGELLAGIDGISTPEIVEGHVFHQYTIRIKNGRRDAVRASLGAAGIATMVYYPLPIDRLPIYMGRYGMFPQSLLASEEVLSLPIWPELPLQTQEFVAAKIRESC